VPRPVLPYSSCAPADAPEKIDECIRAGAAIRKLLELDLKPRDIATRQSFINAMRLTIVLGGSTNAVLHSIAMARAFDSTSPIDDWQKVSDETPLLSDFRPSGKYVMEDLHAVGGVPAVIKAAHRKGLLDGSQKTVTGKTLAENVKDLPGLKTGQQIVHFLRRAHQEGRPHPHPARQPRARGPVAKITGKEGTRFEGTPRCSIPKKTCCTAWSRGDQQGRRDHHPLRRPQGRPRHAGNAHPDQRAGGLRPAQRRRASSPTAASAAAAMASSSAT
jgi:dihydroxy-acid dehydratase